MCLMRSVVETEDGKGGWVQLMKVLKYYAKKSGYYPGGSD